MLAYEVFAGTNWPTYEDYLKGINISEEIKDEFKKLINEVTWNEFVYSATYNFIPVIGETYYLYEKSDNTIFLSLVAPNEWNNFGVKTSNEIAVTI